jgi:hypothetical protein
MEDTMALPSTDEGNGPESDKFNNELDILIHSLWAYVSGESFDTQLVTAPNWVEIAKLTEQLLNIMAASEDASEWFSDLHESPQAFALILMNQFPMGPDERALPKRHWFDIAEEIGPDYAQAMYHASVFMTKVA